MENEQKIFIEQERKFQEAIVMARGHIMQRCIEVENTIDLFIATYFARQAPKQDEMLGLILGPRMTFNNKREVFVYLLENYYTDFIVSHPDLISDTLMIVEERNIFAHYPIDVSNEAKEKFNKDGSLRIQRIKNKKVKEKGETKQKHYLMQHRDLGNKEINLLIKIMYDCRDTIQELVILEIKKK
jgi:hypothetical protein